MTSPPSALIVDDDPGALRLLQMILQEMGFAVRATDQPRLALRHVEDEPPDLLITDLRMPEMSGVDLLRAARRLRPDLCCLVVTGFATDDAIAEVFRAGAHDLLVKPVHLEEVQVRIRNAAELVHLRREVQRLRAAPPVTVEEPAPPAAPRALELAELPAVPGSAAPVDVSSQSEALSRLERLAALFREGAITASEFEGKRANLLDRI